MALTRQHTILCIDDDDDDLELLENAFRQISADLRVEKANNGRQGLQLLEEMHTLGQLPGLVVLDLNMPGLDGRQTFIEIRKHPDWSTVPVIVFSTSILPQDKQFFEAGKVACLTKPIKFDLYKDVALRLLNECGRNRSV